MSDAPTPTAGTLATRIGPIYTAYDLAGHLAGAESGLMADEVRDRARQHQLVGFEADDGEWLFPAWQFDQIEGQLTPHREVIDLWQQLPHGA